MIASRRRLVGLLVLASAAAGCAAVERERPDALSGYSGTVNWEVVGIRTVIPPDGREVEWSYTLILRNTGGPDITFETLEISAQSPGMSRRELLAGVHRESFSSRLATSTELRVNASYRLAFTAGSTGGFGELPGGPEGIIVHYLFLGKDSSGRPVTIAVRVPLDPAAGRRVSPGPARPVSSSSNPASVEARHEPGGVTLTQPAAPESRLPAPIPRPGGGLELLLEAARECQPRFPAIEAVDIDSDGRVTWQSQDIGKNALFQACYEERTRVKAAGRRVPAPVAADRASVALEPEGGVLVVLAVLGQSQPARLVVDTGAGKTVLRPGVLERLGVSVQSDAIRVELTTLSGERIPGIPLARIDSLSVGGVAVADLYVAAYDLLPQLPAVDGVLGLDFLSHFQMRVDRAAGSMTLEPRP